MYTSEILNNPFFVFIASNEPILTCRMWGIWTGKRKKMRGRGWSREWFDAAIMFYNRLGGIANESKQQSIKLGTRNAPITVLHSHCIPKPDLSGQKQLFKEIITAINKRAKNINCRPSTSQYLPFVGRQKQWIKEIITAINERCNKKYINRLQPHSIPCLNTVIQKIDKIAINERG